MLLAVLVKALVYLLVLGVLLVALVALAPSRWMVPKLAPPAQRRPHVPHRLDELRSYDAANPLDPALVAAIPVLHDDDEPRDTLVDIDTDIDSVPACELFSGAPPAPPAADEAEELSP